MTTSSSDGPTVRPGRRRTRLVLARHGETVWHAENRYAGGASDIDLTDRGREQARDLARWAAAREFDALVVSPVRRAKETAAPVAEALGLVAQEHEELREVDFGVAEGRTIEELLEMDAEMVEAFREDPAAHPFPASEPPEEAAARAAGCSAGPGRPAPRAGGCSSWPTTPCCAWRCVTCSTSRCGATGGSSPGSRPRPSPRSRCSPSPTCPPPCSPSTLHRSTSPIPHLATTKE